MIKYPTRKGEVQDLTKLIHFGSSCMYPRHALPHRELWRAVDLVLDLVE